MTVSFKSSPLPTAQDLKAWKAERERVVAEIKNLEFRRENLSRLIAAGEALVPAEQAKTTAPPTDSKRAARHTPAKHTRYRTRQAGSRVQVN